MKRIIIKLIAMVLVFACVFSVTAFAALIEYPKPDRDYVPCQVLLGLKSDVTVDDSYESFFPELEIVEVRVIELEVRTILCLTLNEETKQSVIDALTLLADNPYVEYAYPNYIHYIGDESPDVEVNHGDVSCDGQITNRDVVLAARYTLGMQELTSEQFANADINEDGKVSNRDLVLIARLALN